MTTSGYCGASFGDKEGLRLGVLGCLIIGADSELRASLW